MQERWLAVIYFKNSASSLWRRTAVGAISAEEKGLIRGKLFNGVGEPNKQLNAQNAMAIAKIVRIDFPRDWPTAFQDMGTLVTDAAGANDMVRLHNVLQVLNQVLKTVSMAKFGPARSSMQKEAGVLVKSLGHIYVVLTSTWMNEPHRLAEMEVGYLALKVVTRLVHEGYEAANRYEEARDVFEKLLSHLRGFIDVYQTTPNELIAKHIKRIGKFYHRLFDRQASGFLLMPDSLSVPRFYMQLTEEKAQWLAALREDDDEETVEFFQNTIIQELLLLKKLTDIVNKTSLTSLRHRTDEERQESKKAQQVVSDELFTHGVVSHLTELLLTYYMPLRQSDLELWANSPEEFFVEEQQSSYEYALRAASAHLYVHLLSSFKQSVASEVLQFVENACNIQSEELSDVLRVDAALNAFELGAAVFSEMVQFDHMLVDVFIPKITASQNDLYRIIRRRITLVISEWVGIGAKPETRQEIFKFLVTLLDKNDSRNDIVVELYSLQALRYTVDDWEFKPESFEPYVDVTFARMFEMLQTQLTTIEAKLAVLQVMAVIVEQMGSTISSFFERIVSILPPLWEESGDNHLVKGVILQIITQLTASAGSTAPASQLYALAIPAIQVSANPESPLHPYLFEDALPLWKSLVENAEQPDDVLLSLVPPLLRLIEISTEHISSEIYILESYILLAPRDVLTQSFLSQLFGIFASYVPHMTTEALMTVLEVIELVATLIPLAEYGSSLVQTGLLNVLLEYLLNKEAVSISSAVKIYCILSRMSISNAGDFYIMLNNTGRTNDVIQDWFKRFHNMGRPRERKLNAMGVTVLLSTHDATVFGNFSDLVDIWCELLDEINEESGDSEVYYGNDSFQDPNMPESRRRQAMYKNVDPVHTVAMKTVIREQLVALGNTGQHQLLSSLSIEVQQMLEAIVQ